MIDGVKLRMGGEEYEVPPLNLKSVKSLEGLIKEIDAGGSQFELLPKIAQVVYEALKRNYPDITLDKVEDILDMGNSQAVLKAVLGQSGYKEATPGEAVAASTDQ